MCLWYVNDMLISPINLCFTSRGLLCALHHRWQSCRCRAGSGSRVLERDDCFQICLLSSLSCVPWYICMKKKKIRKTIIMERFNHHQPKKKNGRSNVCMCHLRTSSSLKSLFPSMWSTLHMNNFKAIFMWDPTWCETNLYVWPHHLHMIL